MRPIDADALVVQIRDNVFHDFTDEFWGVMYCIGEAPTVEARRTGKWIWDNEKPFERCRCSECGYYRQLQCPEPDNFCPNCGAKMEGEEMDEADLDYERAVMQYQLNPLYELSFNPEDGSM